MNWTDEQLAIFEAGSSTSDNMLIEALAGAAKSTTLRELATRLRGSVCALAFNKKIAAEMQEKMPSNVTCSTLNSLGHRIWGQHLGKRLRLFDDKMAVELKDILAELPKEEADELSEDFGLLMRALSASKNLGHVPNASAKKYGSKVRPLLTDSEYFEALPDDFPAWVQAILLTILERSFDQAMSGTIDFADQLLMPTVVQCMFPIYENVLVDEAQDLSEANHVMLGKLAKRRIIAVGDTFQAIYAFRGAHTQSMALLQQRFNMTRFGLNTTFRCPEVICQHVRWRAPEICSWDGNPNSPGVVDYSSHWSAEDFPDGSAIVCRNNAPLFRMAIYLLRSGRRPKLWGNDVTSGIVKTLESLGARNMQQKDAIAALNRWRDKKLAKARRKTAIDSVEDRVACMREFLLGADTLSGAVYLAQEIMSRPGSIDLCTGHKSKGYEWNRVFFLDESLCDMEAEQDQNLRYVIATRAKAHLTYINSDGRLE